jgi:hypothetical protein
MKTLKKWWSKITTKAMSMKERFTKIIRDRLSRKNPGTTASKLLTALAFISTIAITAAVFFLTPLAALPGLVIGALPFGAFLSSLIVYLFVFVPISIVLTGVIGKPVFFLLAPWHTHEFAPVKNLLEYPRELVGMINFMLISLTGGLGVVAIFLIQAINKMMWLAETIVGLPYAWFETHSFEGFVIDMKAWFTSWKPQFFMEASLGDVIAKQFKDEQIAEEAAKQAQRSAKKQSKMAPVTPLPAT